MHGPDPTQRLRIAEIRQILTARIAEAEREGWLGEIERLKVSLAGADDKARPDRPAPPGRCPRRYRHTVFPDAAAPARSPMIPAPVIDSLLHALVTSPRAEGTNWLAVAAAITLDYRVLLYSHTTPDFGHEWDQPGADR